MSFFLIGRKIAHVTQSVIEQIYRHLLTVFRIQGGTSARGQRAYNMKKAAHRAKTILMTFIYSPACIRHK
jgi:hypothetical protein